ncbi:hypothetical protein, partial [Nocardia wallacei]|uniref:hypothetical protein n=1 Tax=Nocardia wallacei TaxID=480035 RepID=UPI0024564326
MAQTRRPGRPLPTSPEGFPARLPLPTRELNAALNALLVRSELTYVDVVDENGLALDPKQRSRQMRESTRGPSSEFFDAILNSAARKLGMPVEDLHTEFDPQLERARGSSPEPASKGSAPHQERPRPVTPSAMPVLQDPELQRKADWLADLLIANEEHRAVDELDAVFEDMFVLVEVLVYVGSVDPGMVAALLDELGRRDFPRRTRIFAAVRTRCPDTAARIATVSSPYGDGEPRVLEMNPIIAFGRRLAGVILKDDVGRACREVTSRAAELAAEPESLLAAIIDDGIEGPVSAARLLEALAIDHEKQVFSCILRLIRQTRRTGRRDLLTALTNELPDRACIEILARLSPTVRLPNQVGLVSDELDDLVTFIEALADNRDPARLVTVLTDSRFSRTQRHAAGHIIESIPHLAPLLNAMLTAGHLEPTARLLARAISDWDERLRDWGGLPEMYQPLVDLAEAVFAQQEPVPLVSYLLAKHPH